MICRIDSSRAPERIRAATAEPLSTPIMAKAPTRYTCQRASSRSPKATRNVMNPRTPRSTAVPEAARRMPNPRISPAASPEAREAPGSTSARGNCRASTHEPRNTAVATPMTQSDPA